MATLKEKNRPALSAVLALNTASLVVLLSVETVKKLPELDKSTLFRLALGALAFPLTRLMGGLLKRETKELLVFQGREMPPRRMVNLGHQDQSVNMAQLTIMNGGSLPADAETQHAVYMQWYRSVHDHPSVLDSFGDYLFFRDWAATVTLLGVFFSWLVLFMRGWQLALVFLVVELVQFGLTTLAARNASERMTLNVLSVISTTPKKGRATASSATARPKR